MSIVILVLASWLTAEGLSARFFGSYLTAEAPWQMVSTAAGLTPESMYWPLVWLGVSWLGVLMAVWVGSSWRYAAVLTASSITLLFLGWGTALAVCLLVCTLLPQGKQLLRGESTSEANEGGSDG